MSQVPREGREIKRKLHDTLTMSFYSIFLPNEAIYNWLNSLNYTFKYISKIIKKAKDMFEVNHALVAMRVNEN